MFPAPESSTVMNSASGIRTPDIIAVQDRDCIDRAKFRYDLAAPLPAIFFDQFADAEVTIREFSKSVPFGRDLFNIVKPGVFRADGLVSATKIIVSFNGDPQNWPLDLILNFERRLNAAGYDKIRYIEGEKPKCAECPARFEKKCRASDKYAI